MARPRRAFAPLDAEPEAATPGRSPERQRLADEIERLKRAEAEVAEMVAAIEPAYESIFAAQRALDAAENVLRDARPLSDYESAPLSAPASNSYWGSDAESNDKARLARAMAAGPPVSIADAKAAVEAAQDALDTARRTRQWHKDRHASAEKDLTLRKLYVRDAVLDVLRSEPATLALAQRCQRLATQAAAAREAFAQVIAGSTILTGSPFYGWDMVTDPHAGPDAMSDWAVSRDWRDAIAALATDPDAPLPMP